MPSVLKNHPWLPMLVALGFGLFGLNWGLPSSARAKIFLKPDQQNSEFFQKLAHARAEQYEKIGLNPVAYGGRILRAGQPYEYSHNILSSYSSFLLRTHDGDEQSTLVMLSHLNPLKGTWYPYTFQYGGAYIYPLAAFVGVGHLFHIITLTPNPTFYYEHPDEIASIYWLIRFWSLLGFILSVGVLFYFVRTHWNSLMALWAALAYALLPACLGFSKLAKPHSWSPFWTLLAIHLSFQFKENQRWRTLAFAALCFGIAMGTTLSQWVYVPLLVWASWEKNPGEMIKRIVFSFSLLGAAFLFTNPTLLFHLSDFKNELYFLSHFYPFKMSWVALRDYVFFILPFSLGIEITLPAFLAVGWVYMRDENKLKTLASFLVVSSFLIAFQMQATKGDPISSRLHIAHLGLFCLFFAWITQGTKWGQGVRWVCLLMLIVRAVLYDAHLNSDQAPHDNPSQAGLWIQENFPPGTVIGQEDPIPHADHFPPIPFNDYVFENKAPAIFVVSAKNNEAYVAALSKQGYVLMKRFAQSPLQKWGFKDRFTNANFGVEVYRKNEVQ